MRRGQRERPLFVRKQRISFALLKTALKDLLQRSIHGFGCESNTDLDLFWVLQKKTKCFCWDTENLNPLDNTIHSSLLLSKLGLTTALSLSLMSSFNFLIFSLSAGSLWLTLSFISFLSLLQSVSLPLPLVPCYTSLSSANGWVSVLSVPLFKTGSPRGAQRFPCMAGPICTVA